MKNKKIFFLGIKGVAMTGLAVIYKKLGNEVFGSDTNDLYITDEILKKNSIKCINSFNPKLINKDIDLFVYSAAHGGNKNSLAKKAENLNIKIVNQAELIGKLISNFQNSVAVCGSHGKTTTSSLLSYLLIKLNAEPSYLTGSSGFNNYQGGDYLKDEYFIFEADEYAINPPFDKRIKLNYYRPDSIIITNVDFDHPDVYSNIKDTEKEFVNFLKKGNKVYYCIDNLILKKIVKKEKNLNYFSFGYSDNADLRMSSFKMNNYGSTFILTYKNKNLGQFKTKLFGKDNVSNIAGSILYLVDKGFDIEDIRKVLTSFNGAKRRFEKIYENNDILLFDDYAHHPTEIMSALSTFKKLFSNKRLIVLFHPHTFSRTKTFLSEFANSLSLSFYSIVLPIFSSAREKEEEFHISSLDIEKQAKQNKNNIKAVRSEKEALDILKNIIKKGDIIITMGAGDVYLLHNQIINIIKNIK